MEFNTKYKGVQFKYYIIMADQFMHPYFFILTTDVFLYLI